MTVFLNGRFVAEDQAMVSVFDRGFLYGDGLFETLRVAHGRPFRWPQHWERLERGLALLRLALPFSVSELRAAADQLIRRNQAPECVLRLTLSRGIGPRGYSIQGLGQPTVVISLHPLPVVHPESPPRWRLIHSSVRIRANDPLAGIKSANKLPSILARAEAEAAGVDEGLLSTPEGHVVEAASANLFWVRDGIVGTPPLTSGALPGVTRAAVLELCRELGIPARESNVSRAELGQADGVFLTLSSLGIVEALSLDGRVLAVSPVVNALRQGYARMVDTETG